MKRDMELVRKILIDLSKLDFQEHYKIPENQDVDETVYHLKIMEQGGLITKNILYASNELYVIHAELTWDGNQFLDCIHNENIWSKMKSKLGKELSSMPMKVITSIATKLTTEYAMNQFGFK